MSDTYEKMKKLFDAKAQQTIDRGAVEDLHQTCLRLASFLEDRRSSFPKNVIPADVLLRMAFLLAQDLVENRKLGPALPVYCASLALYAVAQAHGFSCERNSMERVKMELTPEQLTVMQKIAEEMKIKSPS